MNNRKAILVTGDRHATSEKWESVINEIFGREHIGQWAEETVLIHGDCEGIDLLVDRESKHRFDISLIPMPYMSYLGKAGGPTRNRKMVQVLDLLRDVGYTTLVLAFHDSIETSKGTKNCATQAKQHGHTVFLVTSDGMSVDWGIQET